MQPTQLPNSVSSGFDFAFRKILAQDLPPFLANNCNCVIGVFHIFAAYPYSFPSMITYIALVRELSVEHLLGKKE